MEHAPRCERQRVRSRKTVKAAKQPPLLLLCPLPLPLTAYCFRRMRLPTDNSVPTLRTTHDTDGT